MWMLRSTHRHFKLCEDSKNFQCHTLMSTPASPLSPKKEWQLQPPPLPKWRGFQLVCVVKPMLLSAVHLESAVGTLRMLTMCLKASADTRREYCLDSEAKSSNSLSSCLYSWCSAMYMLRKSLALVHATVLSFVTHYFLACCLPPETEDLFLSYRGNTGLCSCLFALLFAPLVIFCARLFAS